jgi:NAD(P)-dependent dehydrogenase (short-subunit alcohol dehydrogenase family)
MTPKPDHGETSYRGSGRLAGRKALITGGDSGIGRAAAIAYAREGADVAIGYLPFEEPDAQEVKALIEKAGRKAVLLPGDIRDEAFCKKLVDDAAKQLGGLDILVSNAARQQSVDSILDLTTEQFDWTIKTNLYANFWICKAAVPHMTKGGAIIVTASVQAYDPSPNLLDYSQTKAAQVAFTKSLAKQLADKEYPGQRRRAGPDLDAAAGERRPDPDSPLQVCGGQEPDALVNFGGDSPMKRPGQPAELAATYVTLAVGRIELHHRAGVWRVGRQRQSVEERDDPLDHRCAGGERCSPPPCAAAQYSLRFGLISCRIVVEISSIDLVVDDSQRMPSRFIIFSASLTS